MRCSSMLATHPFNNQRSTASTPDGAVRASTATAENRRIDDDLDALEANRLRIPPEFVAIAL
jgi:hypothetical protein